MPQPASFPLYRAVYSDGYLGGYLTWDAVLRLIRNRRLHASRFDWRIIRVERVL